MADTIILSLSDRAHTLCSTNYTWEPVKPKLGEVHTLEPRGLRNLDPGLKKFENLVPTCGFHYENLKKFRKNTGTREAPGKAAVKHVLFYSLLFV